VGDREDLLVDGRVVGYVQGSQWLAKRTLDTVGKKQAYRWLWAWQYFAHSHGNLAIYGRYYSLFFRMNCFSAYIMCRLGFLDKNDRFD
jgi:hypothetical protein